MRYALFDTAFGTCGMVWTDAGIVRLLLPERSRSRLMSRITELGEVAEAKPPKAMRAVVRRVKRHLGGKPASALEAPLDLSRVTPFTRRVYEALCEVPPGQTISYGELAARAGSPKAARAVGRAMAVNPMPILIPCHRVIGKDGKPVGFTAYGGLATKAKLLGLEGVQIDNGDALDFDVDQACRHLRRVDPELRAVMKRVGPARLSLEPGRNTFAALAEAIVYQQLTGRAAATIFRRVLELFPKRRTLRAEDVAGASEETLRSAGLSRAKATAMHDLARKQLAGELPSFRKLAGMSDEAIINTLTRVRGVGRWTVEMLLIFRLGRPDVLAVGDYALRKAFSQIYGLDDVATPKAFTAHGERWRPYRTMACWYLWRSLEL